MANWHEILKNRGAYPDTAEVTSPTGERFSLGQVREAFIAREEEIKAREERIEAQAHTIAEARGELATVFQGVMAEKEELAAKRAELEAGRAAVSRGWVEDGAASSDRIQKMEQEIREGRARLEELGTITRQSVEQYVKDSFDRDLSGLELPKGVTQSDVIKYATIHNIKRGNLPDLRAAVEKMREPEMTEKRIKEAEQKGFERGQQKALLESLHGGMRTISPTDEAVPGLKRFKSMDEAIEAAGQDPEIQAMISGLVPPSGA